MRYFDVTKIVQEENKTNIVQIKGSFNLPCNVSPLAIYME